MFLTTESAENTEGGHERGILYHGFHGYDGLVERREGVTTENTEKEGECHGGAYELVAG